MKYLLVFLLLFLAGCQFDQPFMKKEIKFKDVVLKIETVTTSQAMAKGLGGRDILCQNCGMLFEYPDYQIRHFWMKDMKFPLDVLWLAGNRVVGLQENIPIKTNNGQVVRFQSNAPSDMVLEVNAGWIRSQGVKTGDMVVYN